MSERLGQRPRRRPPAITLLRCHLDWPLEFLLRFTAAERTAIRAAAAVSPELADWIDQARFAREIELDAPTTAAGLDALVAAGLLTAERRAVVLA